MKKNQMISYALITSMIFAGLGSIGTKPVEVKASSNVPIAQPTYTQIPTQTSIADITLDMSGRTPSCNTHFPDYTSTIVPATTAVPPTYIVPATTTVPPAYVVPPTTAVPPTYVVPPTTAVPPTYVVPATTPIPPTTKVPSSQTSTPIVTPSATPKLSFDTFFTLTKKVTFDASRAPECAVSGTHISLGLKSVYFNGRQLGSDDYSIRYNSYTGKESLVFSYSFCQTLVNGDNEITYYATYNEDAMNVKETLIITKINGTDTPTTPIPIKTPTPSPSPKINFDTFFVLGSEVDYDELFDTECAVGGSHISLGLKGVYYDGVGLTSDECFIRVDELGNEWLIFTEDFLNKLPYGSNQITYYATYNQDAINLKEKLVINKIYTEPSPTTVVKTPVPADKTSFNVSVASNGTNAVSQKYVIKQTAGDAADLKDLVIRYYYKYDSSKSQQFSCNHAGITLKSAPYYVDATKLVAAEFGDGYVDIKFNDSCELKDGSLTLDVRFNYSDWSNYSDNVNEGKIEVYYKGALKK